MQDVPGWGRVRRLADHQFGLFTTAQARELGVPAYVLARLALRDQVIRVHHGVYECPDSSSWVTFGDWAAQWLALQPAADIDDRRQQPDALVSHSAAAQLLGLGTITATGLELSAPHRINVRDPQVRTWRRDIGQRGRDWELVDGLPVTTPLRTLADLLDSHGDGGHLGTAIHTCLSDGIVDHDDIVAVCEHVAPRWGHDRGSDLLSALLVAAQMQPNTALAG